MNAPLRRGACPSLSEPMPTGDGFLVRLVLDYPGIEPAKLKSILCAANRHGSGIVEITARGNLQIRGLNPHSARRLEREINALDLQVGGLPITLGALAGLDEREIADPLPVAASIRQALSSALTAKLAAKTSIVIDGGGKVSVDQISADIRLLAVEAGTNPLWQLSIGGNAVDARPVAIVRQSAVADLVIQLLSRMAVKGKIARGSDLGKEEIADLTLVSGKEFRSVTGRSRPCIGTFALADGLFGLGVATRFGACHADDLIQLLDLIERRGMKTVRLAPGRVIMIPGLTDNQQDDLKTAAADLGFITEPDDRQLAISMCAGAPCCGSAHVETKKLASNLALAAGELLDGSFTLHVSGCEKRCADVTGPRVSVIGQPGTCRLQRELDDCDLLAVDVSAAELLVMFSALNTRFCRCAKSAGRAETFLRDLSIEQLCSEVTE